MAKKPKAHKIDDRAKRYIHSRFDDISSLNEFQPDYGIDFRIQMLSEGDALSPKVFLMQLKGTEKPETTVRNNRKYIVHRLKLERLRDYLQSYREPVFLMVVDTLQQSAVWVFMQAYPDSGLLPPNWHTKTRGNVPIYIPIQNCLSDIESFQKALDQAIAYMADRFPGTPQAALQSAARQFKLLDPRFDVSWELINGTLQPHFHAVENSKCTFNFRIDNHERLHKFDLLVEKGVPVEFTKDEIEIIGLPMVASGFNRGPVTIQWAKKFNIYVSISKKNDTGAEIGRFDCLRGTMTSGNSAYRFEANAGDGLISVSGEADMVPTASSVNKFKMKVEIEKWFKKPVRNLLFFPQIYSVFGTEERDLACIAEIHLVETGSILEVALNVTDDNEYFTLLRGWLGVFDKLRFISHATGKNFAISSKGLIKENVEDIYRIYHLLKNGSRTIPFENSSVTMDVSSLNTTDFLKGDLVSNISLNGLEVIDFVEGEPLRIGNCVRDINYAQLVNRDDITRQIESNHTGPFKLILRGVKGSTIKESIVF